MEKGEVSNAGKHQMGIGVGPRPIGFDMAQTLLWSKSAQIAVIARPHFAQRERRFCSKDKCDGDAKSGGGAKTTRRKKKRTRKRERKRNRLYFSSQSERLRGGRGRAGSD